MFVKMEEVREDDLSSFSNVARVPVSLVLTNCGKSAGWRHATDSALTNSLVCFISVIYFILYVYFILFYFIVVLIQLLLYFVLHFNNPISKIGNLES